MTDFIFKCNDEAINNKLMDTIWEAIRYWIEFERKEMILGRWHDNEGFHVGLTIDEKAKVIGSLSIDTFDIPKNDYELILKKDEEEKRIIIPVQFIPSYRVTNHA